jgi:hypothetical protein
VNFLILITTFVGFHMASANDGRPFSFARLFNTLLGTLFVASGTGTLNQYLEREFDGDRAGCQQRRGASGLERSRSQTHRLERYLASDDREFESKAADITGLYLRPPQHAAVFCVDACLKGARRQYRGYRGGAAIPFNSAQAVISWHSEF